MYRFTLRALTPIFLNGAEPDGDPEVRAPSVRGQIRFWFRALQGAYEPTLDLVWKQEEQCLGSTRIGSSVSIRFYGKGNVDCKDERVLRHGTKKFTRKAIRPGTEFDLQIVARPGAPIPQAVLDAVKLWLLLGGIGKRSRRMFGAFDVIDWNKEFWRTLKPSSPAAYKSLVNRCLQDAVRSNSNLQSVYRAAPTFSTLNPAYSRVLVSNDSWDHWEDAMLYLFEEWLRSPKPDKQAFIKSADTFGYVDGGKRRASPLIAQVRYMGDGYYPVFTFMRSEFPDSKPMNWKVLSQFRQGIESDLSALTAWGEL